MGAAGGRQLLDSGVYLPKVIIDIATLELPGLRALPP